VGTFFRNVSGIVIADLQHSGDSFIAARGGAGGKGNYFFLTNENRAPTTYEEGGRGEEKIIYAELRAIADIGMVCRLPSRLLSPVESGFMRWACPSVSLNVY